MSQGELLLSVRDLHAGFATDSGWREVLDGISFDLKAGQTLGLVGESGCGKSVTALAIMGLLAKPAGKISGGSIRFQDRELTSLNSDELSALRGKRISMIFQEPMTALNPVLRIGHQLDETLRRHLPDLDESARNLRTLAMLNDVGIPAAEQRLRDYPHQLSGGMRQRVMIAMALLLGPDLLIADEPTTALDVTVQAQILELIARLQKSRGMAVLFITHDLGVVSEVCDEVVVMYAGRIAERAQTDHLFRKPTHPYTRGLLNSIPRLQGIPKTKLSIIPGSVPALADMPTSCRFADRCSLVSEQCRLQQPPLTGQNEHQFACWHAEAPMPSP